jgi:glycosyltransferase involved in cell wall biosynthesis
VTVRVSLVIPVQDEEATLPALLASIENQSRPPDELIFVNAGSRDRTGALLAQSRVGTVTRLRVLEEGRLHPWAARNAGIRAATCPWVAFTDAGIRLDARWLERLVTSLGSPPADAAFGTIQPSCEDTFRQCAAVAYVPPPGPEGIRGPSVASILLRRSLLDDLGGFPPFRAAEDLIFLERLRAARPKVSYATEAVALWTIPGSTGATFRRFALYSFHNLVARRGRFWHAGVLRLYLVLSVLVGIAVAAGPPAFAAFAVPGFFLARAGRAAWIKRGTLPFPIRMRHVVGAAGLLVLIDGATLLGATRWLLSGRPR